MEQALELLDKIGKDQEWFDNNIELLKKRYDQKFVAVRDGRVVVSADTLESAIEELKKQNINPAQTLIRFVSKVSIIL